MFDYSDNILKKLDVWTIIYMKITDLNKRERRRNE